MRETRSLIETTVYSVFQWPKAAPRNIIDGFFKRDNPRLSRCGSRTMGKPWQSHSIARPNRQCRRSARRPPKNAARSSDKHAAKRQRKARRPKRRETRTSRKGEKRAAPARAAAKSKAPKPKVKTTLRAKPQPKAKAPKAAPKPAPPRPQKAARQGVNKKEQRLATLKAVGQESAREGAGRAQAQAAASRQRSEAGRPACAVKGAKGRRQESRRAA